MSRMLMVDLYTILAYAVTCALRGRTVAF